MCDIDSLICFYVHRDSNMTVSYLKKYLMVKLGLESEDQVN